MGRLVGVHPIKGKNVWPIPNPPIAENGQKEGGQKVGILHRARNKII